MSVTIPESPAPTAAPQAGRTITRTAAAPPPPSATATPGVRAVSLVAALPSTIFASLCTPAVLPTWVPAAGRVRAASADWPRAGAWLRHGSRSGLGKSRTVVVLEHSPPHRLVLVARGRHTTLLAVDVARTGEASRVTLTTVPLHGRAGAVPGRVRARLRRVRQHRALRRLSRQVVERAGARSLLRRGRRGPGAGGAPGADTDSVDLTDPAAAVAAAVDASGVDAAGVEATAVAPPDTGWLGPAPTRAP